MQAIKQQFKENLFRLQLSTLPDDMISDAFDIVKHAGNQLTVKINDTRNSNDVLKHFINRNITVEAFHEVLPSLNEVFIKQVEGTTLTRQFQNLPA